MENKGEVGYLGKLSGWIESFTSNTPVVPRRVLIFLAAAIVVSGFLLAWVGSSGDSQQPEAVTEFPTGVEFPLADWIDEAVEWMATDWRYEFFRNVSDKVLWFLVRIERFLLWVPWWVVLGLTTIVTWRIVGVKLAGIGLGGLLFIGAVGMWDRTMQTLALVVVSTLMAVAIAIPTGVAMAKNRYLEALIRPTLDLMQTMPSFVYLIPALMLFGLGKVPAVMATIIYAVPPAIRLTNLGIRLVDKETVEAARSFGTTDWQLLFKVQLPLALPNIMAGVNQTIMMALAMVVIASLVGAGGLGAEVLKGIARLDVGTGFVAGMGIVIMAVLIDRISQNMAKSRRTGAGEL